MSVITISRGSYSRGKEIAEKVAAELGYECISRDILLEASDQFNIPEIKLIRAIHDAPSVLERFTYGKERYMAYIRAALLHHLQKDNIVYHGLAGHFFVQGIPHILKIRVIADIEDRVREEMKRVTISAEKARYNLLKDDDERRRWGMRLYGKDTVDPNLYDMVLHIQTMTVNEAVKIILETIKLPCYQTTWQSKRKIDNLSLAAQAEAAIWGICPVVSAIANDGTVRVSIKAPVEQTELYEKKVAELVAKIEGVRRTFVEVVPEVVAE